MRLPPLKKRGVLPGFGITLGITMTWLCLVVLIPLSALAFQGMESGLAGFARILSEPRVLSAFRVSFGLSCVAALVNALFGTVLAWVLVRYRFPGRRIVDAMVDLPFALPTAVAGIALTALYAENGWIGSLLAPYGIKIAFTPLGVTIALIFVGLPFVVRTLEPVLHDFDRELEEAAASLGATPLQTFLRIILPQIAPAILSGFAMAFARALGEYGSVIFIAGNMPGVSEIVPLLIVIRLEQYDYTGSAIIALVTLAASFAILLLVNSLQSHGKKR